MSAHVTLSRGQRITAGAGALALAGAMALTGVVTVLAACMVTVTLLYAAGVGYKLWLIFQARGGDVLRFTELPGDDDLPPYTVLVPLHREGRVVPALLRRLAALDYPADRLQVLLLVEEDDEDTAAALPGELPPGFELVLIPAGEPRTKPKACNVGLERARGEFCVIYDAEDRPEPSQLRKAVAAFAGAPRWVVCVQAELHYWNPWTNWLTRCFTAEYALNFSLFLRGLDRYRMPIPLGGTSNHFRADALRELGAWDPYNVTEDADLGIRIARRGWSVRMMDSVTEEEANSRLGNWVRQRSRWIKGYMQTWLVHMRSPRRLWRELGARGFWSFQFTVGFSVLCTLLNPVLWALTALYLVAGPSAVEALFPGVALYLGTMVMVAGNLLLMLAHMAGCLERSVHEAVRTMLLVPLYWALMSVAAFRALVQLARPSRRFHWELTEHGLVPDSPGAT
ncbi:glycosyltransferase [Nonomuraea sp. NPDC049725]|uniref:glycosyltransferase family 2 protein n=1 Tax=Nonomuraea sp. NPDC049725 TaxID=3154508 RepID=UPI0034405F0B